MARASRQSLCRVAGRPRAAALLGLLLFCCVARLYYGCVVCVCCCGMLLLRSEGVPATRTARPREAEASRAGSFREITRSGRGIPPRRVRARHSAGAYPREKRVPGASRTRTRHGTRERAQRTYILTLYSGKFHTLGGERKLAQAEARSSGGAGPRTARNLCNCCVLYVACSVVSLAICDIEISLIGTPPLQNAFQLPRTPTPGSGAPLIELCALELERKSCVALQTSDAPKKMTRRHGGRRQTMDLVAST